MHFWQEYPKICVLFSALYLEAHVHSVTGDAIMNHMVMGICNRFIHHKVIIILSVMNKYLAKRYFETM